MEANRESIPSRIPSRRRGGGRSLPAPTRSPWFTRRWIGKAGKNGLRRRCRLLDRVQKNGLRLLGTGGEDGEDESQPHEDPPGDPGGPGKDRGGLPPRQDPLGGGDTAAHCGQASTLTRLEEDHDSQEESV